MKWRRRSVHCLPKQELKGIKMTLIKTTLRILMPKMLLQCLSHSHSYSFPLCICHYRWQDATWDGSLVWPGMVILTNWKFNALQLAVWYWMHSFITRTKIWKCYFLPSDEFLQLWKGSFINQSSLWTAENYLL